MAKKYTIKEFFESDEQLAIHTPSEEEAIKLCDAFHSVGYSWGNGISYKKDCKWGIYKMDTAYSNDFYVGATAYYSPRKYTILSIEDIIFDDDKEPKEYNVKIEVKSVSDESFCVLINGNEMYWWNNRVDLDDEETAWLNCIMGNTYTAIELQEHLVKKHLVETTKMTIKQIEEKLGIENLEIVEEQ